MKKIIVSLLLLFRATFAFAQVAVDLEPVKKSILASNVTVDTTADALPTTALSGRRAIAIKNNSSTVAYIGHSGVSSTNGFHLKQDESITLDVSDDIVVYGIVASGTADIRIIEIR